jgi:hypothetical protein
VPSYTSLDFTFKSDQLLATAIGQFRPGIYVAGIWKRPMSEEDLLWYINASEAGTKIGAENVPTWSWAAVDGEVAFITTYDQRRFKKHVKFQLQNLVENPPQYGTPSYRPSLFVSGLFTAVRISGLAGEWYPRSKMNHSVQVSSLEGNLAATSLQQSTIHYVRQRQRELIFFSSRL